MFSGMALLGMSNSKAIRVHWFDAKPIHLFSSKPAFHFSLAPLQAIKSGIADANDPTLKDRVAAVKMERGIAQVTFGSP